MLKIFILLVLFSTVLADTTFREKLSDAGKKCEKEHSVTLKEIADLSSEIAGDTDKIDRKYKCFVKCAMDELNIKDESGKVDFKQIGQLYYPTDSYAQEALTDCSAKYDSEADDCERHFKTIACATLTLDKERSHHEE